MKRYGSIWNTIVLVILLGAFVSCDEEVSNPSFAEDAVPRIFGWATTYSTNLEDTLSIAIQVSPSDGAAYQWFIDDEEVATTRSLTYKFDTAREFTLRYVVTRNGVENSREGSVIVNKPFVPKSFNKKMVGFLTTNGTLQDIDFDHLTHLVISSAVVGEVAGQESLVDTTFENMNIPLMVQAAHNAGVYVLLDVTGNMVLLNGGGLYADYGFFNVIADAEKREQAITTFIKFAEDNGMDGVNIYLNNTSEGYLDQEVVSAFFNEIPNYLPAEDFLYTASVPGGWTTTVLAPVAAVEAIDWVNIQPYRYEDLTPTDHSPLWGLNDLVATWMGLGLPAEKIVGGFPAFGLKYDMPTDGTQVTWGNLWQYTEYMSFRTILGIDATAHTKSVLDVDDGIYYDGHDKIVQKAEVVIDQDLGGLMMWSIESDTKDQEKSLLHAAYSALGND